MDFAKILETLKAEFKKYSDLLKTSPDARKKAAGASLIVVLLLAGISIGGDSPKEKAKAAGKSPREVSKTADAAADKNAAPVAAAAKTAAPCTAAPGTACPDGTVFAGISPDGKMSLFATRCDAGQSWEGSACTGARSAIAWNNGKKENMTKTETAGNDTDGVSNTSRLVALVDAGGPYQAALVCDGLEEAGYDDWYLPAMAELRILMQNAPAIGGFEISNKAEGLYWSSTETEDEAAAWVVIADGATEVKAGKQESLSVRCVRKTPAENVQAANSAAAPRPVSEPAVDVTAAGSQAYNLSAEALLALGNAYYKGSDVGKDHKEAVRWWRAAAEREHGLAQLYLGIAYHTGDGVAKNDVEAVKWFNKAIARGYGDAQNYLMKYNLVPDWSDLSQKAPQKALK